MTARRRATPGTSGDRPRRTLEVAGVCAVAVLVGWGCTVAGVPASWIFAFLVVFGGYAILRNRQVTPSTRLMQPAQVLIAMVCTAPLFSLDGPTVLGYLVPTLLSVVAVPVKNVVTGWLLWRAGATDAVSAVMSTLAGGASAMVILARELHADVRFITLTQYLRLSLVVLTLPLFVQLMGGSGGAGHGGGGVPWWEPAWRPVVGAAVIWGVTWLLIRVTSRWFSVPAPYLLISMLVTWLAGLAGVPDAWISPEGLILVAGYAVIGVQAGGTLTITALRTFARSLPLILTAVGVMILGAVAAAVIIASTTSVDLLDAYLATVPGGIYAVLAFAHDAGSAPVVTVGQVLRTLVMVVVGSYLPRILPPLVARWRRR